MSIFLNRWPCNYCFFAIKHTHSHTSFPLLSPYDVNTDSMHGTSVEPLTHTTPPPTPAITPLQPLHWKAPLLLYVLNIYEYHFQNWIVLVWWSKWNCIFKNLPFLPAGFSPAPVTKHHRSTRPWFNPFEILPIKMRSVCRVWFRWFDIANIH